MIKTFTEHDLVRFVYNEVTVEQQSEVKNALLTEIEMQDTVSDFELIREKVDQLLFEAPQRVVDKILEYSREVQSQSV